MVLLVSTSYNLIAPSVSTLPKTLVPIPFIFILDIMFEILPITELTFVVVTPQLNLNMSLTPTEGVHRWESQNFHFLDTPL